MAPPGYVAPRVRTPRRESARPRLLCDGFGQPPWAGRHRGARDGAALPLVAPALPSALSTEAGDCASVVVSAAQEGSSAVERAVGETDAAFRCQSTLGGREEPSALHRVGPWSPVTPVEVVPALTGGDRLITKDGTALLRELMQGYFDRRAKQDHRVEVVC